MHLPFDQPTPAFRLLRKLATNQLRGDAIQAGFDQIAVELMADSVLICGHHTWAIQELEFYYYNLYVGHTDPYCEWDDRRQIFSSWNFQGYEWKHATLHRIAPVRSLELTFGNYHLDIYGGIVIRKLLEIGDGSLIDGRDAIVQEILATLGQRPVTALSLARYYRIHLSPADPHQEIGLNLRTHSFPAPRKVQRTARRQLPPITQDDRGYANLKYRYFVE